MAYADLTNYSEVLKTFYLPAIQDQLNRDNFLSAKIEVNEEDVSGKDATIECKFGRSGGTGSRKDYGTLPTADYQKYKTMEVPMKYQYGRVTFSGPTIAATRDEKGSYARVVDSEITGIVDDLKKEVNRQYWGCGYGILARWYSGTTSNYVLQKRYAGNAVEPSAFGSTFGGKYVEENGWAVAVLPTFSSGEATAFTVGTANILVTAVSEGTYVDTTTAAVDDGITCAAGAFYIRPANLTTAASISAATAATIAGYRQEMMGLAGIVTDTDVDDVAFNDGTASASGFKTTTDPLQGLTIGSYSWWKANVDSHVSGRYAGQRALTLNMMQKMFDKIEKKTGVGYGPDALIMPHAMRREYLELCQADRRSVNEMVLDGGFVGLDYNGIPLMVDVDAIEGEIHFLTMKDIQLYRMSDYDWMDKDGSLLSRISGVDAYEAVLYRYAELGCKRRNSQGVITDLSYSD